jgi:HD-GYP domain-containing protein (c-di-GMP phosphodiesterase class II)
MPETTLARLSATQRRELEEFGERICRLGGNFATVDADGQLRILLNAGRFESDAHHLIEVSQSILNQYDGSSPSPSESPVWRLGDQTQLLAAPLMSPLEPNGQGQLLGVAIIDLGPAEALPQRLAAPDSPAESTATQEGYFTEMLSLLQKNVQATSQTNEQIEMVGTELARVYEELVLLHRISTNMRVTESDSNFLQLACDSLTDIVLVEGIAILLERRIEGEKRVVVAAGSGLIDIDERMAAVLYGRLKEDLGAGCEALLDSEVDTPFKYDWPPSIRNIIAVPLCAKEKGDATLAAQGSAAVSIIGLMVAVNRVDKADFDSTDVKLFTSVASGCAVFIENGRLFNDLKELFVGSLKALTSSIDAKDQYTAGHSERVALISRWIAERMASQYPLDEEQIHRIYLAGLLHDIGKIGIDENVLRKTGKLTTEERECIRRHPCIGASILREIKQMRDIVPGVLCHHERVDGKGYPDGLVGDQIPLTGKIVGLADSFDAMTSKRTYRDAMSVEHALDEIRRGLGTQFDETVGTVFLASDIQHLWELIKDGGTHAYGVADFVDYGTEAIGTLLR